MAMGWLELYGHAATGGLLLARVWCVLRESCIRACGYYSPPRPAMFDWPTSMKTDSSSSSPPPEAAPPAAAAADDIDDICLLLLLLLLRLLLLQIWLASAARRDAIYSGDAPL